jgi:GDP-mannose 6-dehydrogenase
LPKDLRALTRYGDEVGLRLQLLNSVLPANDAQIQRGLRLVQEAGCRKIGLVGLGFKAGTDDLRESPLVILAETLLGRGFDVRIYDPHVQVSRLRGRNLAYVDRHLPHLAALFVETPEALYEHAGLLVLGTDVAKALDLSSFAGSIVDLRRDLAMPVAEQQGEAGGAASPELCMNSGGVS